MAKPKLANAPALLTVQPWADYAVLDTGGGRKLEQVGPFVISRPEPSALWPQADTKRWGKVTAGFAASREDEEAAGQWTLHAEWPETWPMAYRTESGEIGFWGRRTNFRHIGFFPEQEAQWRWLASACAKLSKIKPAPRILNLFGYSGVMSLIAGQAGAAVTHVDASRKSVGWARENAALSGLEAAPIRWIVDDAAKFAAREVRRGSQYDGIILDPPKFGRGPDGETWEFFRDLPGLLADCAKLLSADDGNGAGFIILTGYSARLSARSLAELLAAHLPGSGGTIDYGDYTLEDKAQRQLGLALFARWSKRL